MLSYTCGEQNRNENIAAELLCAVQSMILMLLNKNFWKGARYMLWPVSDCLSQVGVLLRRLNGEVLSCYSNKTKTVGLRICPYY